jgi:Trp operon repressor
MLRTEHAQMLDLLKVIDCTDDAQQRMIAVQELLQAVLMHSEIEQRLFCPSVVRHIRYADMTKSLDDFNAFQKLLADITSGQTTLPELVAHAEEQLEKHIFDSEELMFLPIENKCSDVTYSLSQLSARMHAKKRELEKQLGIAKAS